MLLLGHARPPPAPQPAQHPGLRRQVEPPGQFLRLFYCTVLVCSKEIAALTDFSGYLTKLLQNHTAYACDGDHLNLQCPRHSTISVQSAFYGQDFRMCSSQQPAPEREDSLACVAPTTLQKVLDECQNQRACHLLVNSRVFGPDLCPGSSKYLLVSFKCQPNELKNKTVCEDQELKLHCHESKFLNIYSATYGRRTQQRDACASEAGWLPPFVPKSILSAIDPAVVDLRPSLEQEDGAHGNVHALLPAFSLRKGKPRPQSLLPRTTARHWLEGQGMSGGGSELLLLVMAVLRLVVAIGDHHLVSLQSLLHFPKEKSFCTTAPIRRKSGAPGSQDELIGKMILPGPGVDPLRPCTGRLHPWFLFLFLFIYLFLTSRVDSEREKVRKRSSFTIGSPSNGCCGRRTTLIRSQEPGASPGLPWGAGPKHLGHPPLHSLATAESWPGRGATGTESGAPTGTRTWCAGAARRRISLVSRGASPLVLTSLQHFAF
uniref:SUEL-type lectin domain-containing protein n=1 Tax=Oryctolagus cuniculus TaxID=9986 RepID=A0A5F9CWV9_RABIT